MPSIPAPNTSDNTADLDRAQPQTGAAPADPAHAETLAQFNEAGVRNAQANWLDGINALLYAPDTGYLQQRGAAAVGGYAPAQQAMGKLTQQAQDSLADDHQRGLFTQATAPLLAAAQARLSQHAQTQGRVYDADASRARALSARDLAVNAWNPAPGADNSNYRQCAAILHNELENQFRHAWGEPAGDNQALWDHYLQHGPNGDDGMASLTTGVVNRLLAANQPRDAQAFLGQIQHTLPAPTRDKLSQFVTAAIDQHAGIGAALQAQASGSDPAAQQEKLDTLRDDGHISEEAHAIATHKIQADQAAKLAAQQQNDAQTLKKVWALKNANPNAELTDLGSADYAYLKSRGLDANALAILQSHPATDDPGLYNQLHRMATQDPVSFGKENLLAHSGKLSRAHMEYLTGLQDAVNKQDPQAIQAGKRINMTVNALMGGTQSGGTADDPTAPGTDIHAEQDQAHELEAGLRDHLIAAQQNDPKLTLEDLHAAGAYFLKDWALYGDGYGARANAQQAQNGYLLSPELLRQAAAANAAEHVEDSAEPPAGDMPEKQTQGQSAGASMAGTDKVQSKPNAQNPVNAVDEATSRPSEAKFEGIAQIAAHLDDLAINKGTLKWGQGDQQLDKVPGNKKGQVAELQRRLGIKVTGVYDKRTVRAAKQSFIAMVLPWADAAEKKYGIPTAVTIGQAMLESKAGLHVPTDVDTHERSFNLFGMKAKDGQDCVSSWTKERDAKTGTVHDVLDDFARYTSFEQSVMEHSAFLKEGSPTFRSRNPGYDAMLSSRDPAVWAKGLEKAGYATGKDYAKKLMESIHQFESLRKNMKVK